MLRAHLSATIKEQNGTNGAETGAGVAALGTTTIMMRTTDEKAAITLAKMLEIHVNSGMPCWTDLPTCHVAPMC